MQLKSLTLAACCLPLVARPLSLQPVPVPDENLLHRDARTPAHFALRSKSSPASCTILFFNCVYSSQVIRLASELTVQSFHLSIHCCFVFLISLPNMLYVSIVFSLIILSFLILCTTVQTAGQAWCLMLDAFNFFYFRMLLRIILNCKSMRPCRGPLTAAPPFVEPGCRGNSTAGSSITLDPGQTSEIEAGVLYFNSPGNRPITVSSAHWSQVPHPTGSPQDQGSASSEDDARSVVWHWIFPTKIKGKVLNFILIYPI